MDILNKRTGELLEGAKQALAANEIEVDWNLNQHDPQTRIDGIATLTLDQNTYETPFVVRKQLRPSTIGLLPSSLPAGTLIVSEYISKAVGDALRRQDFNYVDTAGNASISAPGIRIYFDRLQRSPAKTSTATLFTKATIPVILAVLNRPELIHFPIRELQARTNSSLGTTHRVQQQLRANGIEYTPQEDTSNANRRRWRNLFEGWSASYATFRETIVLSRYTSSQPLQDLHAAIAEVTATASGELAAAICGSDIRPASADIYLDGPIAPLLRAAKLRPDSAGPITIRKSIWTSKMLDDLQTVDLSLAPSPIVYADLASIVDPRVEAVARTWIASDENLRSFLQD